MKSELKYIQIFSLYFFRERGNTAKSAGRMQCTPAHKSILPSVMKEMRDKEEKSLSAPQIDNAC